MTSYALKQPISELKDVFAHQQWVYLPGFVTADQAAKWDTESRGLPGREVYCKVETVTWFEQVVPSDHAISTWFADESVVDLVNTMSGSAGAMTCKQIWLSRYGKDQFIEPHRDRAGDCQILTCLEADPAEGGMFVLAPNGETATTVQLRPGDAVIYAPSTVTHWTTRLTATGSRAEPRRAVVDARYQR